MQDKSKQPVKVTIEQADGGIIVSCGEEKYIYKNIKKASRELPALFSVGEAEAPEEDEKSLKEMKANLPKADK